LRTAGSVDGVVGNKLCIGHDQLDAIEGDAEFLGGGHGDFGACALAAFDLAGEHGDVAVFADVEAGGKSRAGLGIGGDGKEQAGAGDFEKFAAI
jgi:hypothetical protein